MKETVAPAGFKLSQDVYCVSVEQGQAVVTVATNGGNSISGNATDGYVIKNFALTSEIRLIKQYEAKNLSNEELLRDTEFTLYKGYNGTELSGKVSSASPTWDQVRGIAVVSFEDVKVPTDGDKIYYLKETKSPTEYTRSNTVYECKIDTEGNVTYKVYGSNDAYSTTFPICNNLLVTDPVNPENPSEDASEETSSSNEEESSSSNEEESSSSKDEEESSSSKDEEESSSSKDEEESSSSKDEDESDSSSEENPSDNPGGGSGNPGDGNEGGSEDDSDEDESESGSEGGSEDKSDEDESESGSEGGSEDDSDEDESESGSEGGSEDNSDEDESESGSEGGSEDDSDEEESEESTEKKKNNKKKNNTYSSEEPPKAELDDVPKTGDHFSVGWLALLVVVSGIVMMITRRAMNKEEYYDISL